jgi:hypothetical protein
VGKVQGEGEVETQDYDYEYDYENKIVLSEIRLTPASPIPIS